MLYRFETIEYEMVPMMECALQKGAEGERETQFVVYPETLRQKDRGNWLKPITLLCLRGKQYYLRPFCTGYYNGEY
jgi:hypothetical protein